MPLDGAHSAQRLPNDGARSIGSHGFHESQPMICLCDARASSSGIALASVTVSIISFTRYAVKFLISLAAIAAAALVQGCATPSMPSMAPQADAARLEPVPAANTFSSTNPISAIAICAAPEGCGGKGQGLARGDEIGVEKNAPPVEGHPLTSVVVTQCNLVVAVYMTMPDGRLLRFDNK